MRKLFLVLSMLLFSSPSFAALTAGGDFYAVVGSGYRFCSADSFSSAAGCIVQDYVANGSTTNVFKTVDEAGGVLKLQTSYGLQTFQVTKMSGYSGSAVGCAADDHGAYGCVSDADITTRLASSSFNSLYGGGSCQYGGTYPACDPAPTCQYGGTYPACDPAPTCQYGGTYPSCDPAPTCQYGGTYPACNAAPDNGGASSGTWDSITAGVDFSTVIIAILAVFAALASAAVAYFGGSRVLQALGLRDAAARLEMQGSGFSGAEIEKGLYDRDHFGELNDSNSSQNYRDFIATLR